MIKRTVLIGVLVLAIVACSNDSSTGTSSTSSSTSSSSSSSSSSSTASSSSAGALALAMNTKLGQAVIVDSAGMTLYLYEPDGTSTTSTVPAGIKSNWPPAIGDSATVGAGLDAAKAKANTQSDGTSQLSYNGHLLYLFVGDTKAGDANGQALGGVWFVLSAAGEKIAA
jgi:predicted lipoprotein with Yx(FWY)xxD motif